MVRKIVCEAVRREVTVGSRRCQAGRSYLQVLSLAGPISGHLGPDPGKRPAGVRWRTPVSPVRGIAL